MGGTPPTSNEDIQSHPIGGQNSRVQNCRTLEEKKEEGKGEREEGEKAVNMTGVGLVVFRFKSPPQAEKYFALKKKPDLPTQVYCSLIYMLYASTATSG